MFVKKGRKGLQEVKSPITYYNTIFPDLSNMQEIYVFCADPGMVNPAIRIESRNQVTNVIKTIMTVKFDVYQLSDIKLPEHINQAPMIIFNILNQYKQYIMACHIIIIEKQLQENYKALCVSKYMLSWMILNFSTLGLQPMILELDSKAKYKYLDVPKDLNEKAKKRFGTQLAINLLQMRGDIDTINLINSTPLSKRDDLCDVIIMIEALFKYYGWKTTVPLQNVPVIVQPQQSYPNIIVQGNNEQTQRLGMYGAINV